MVRVSQVQLPEICEAVSGQVGVSVDDMRSRKRTQRIAFARHLSMFLARELTDMTVTEVGAFFSHRDHTTVCYAVERVHDLLIKDDQVAELVEKLITEIRGAKAKAKASNSVRRTPSYWLGRLEFAVEDYLGALDEDRPRRHRELKLQQLRNALRETKETLPL